MVGHLCHPTLHHPGFGERHNQAEDDWAKLDVRQTRTWAMPTRGREHGTLHPAPGPGTILPCFSFICILDVYSFILYDYRIVRGIKVGNLVYPFCDITNETRSFEVGNEQFISFVYFDKTVFYSIVLTISNAKCLVRKGIPPL